MAFFTPPNGKKQFHSMPMGATNSHAAFVAMVFKRWRSNGTNGTKKDAQKAKRQSGICSRKDRSS